MMLNQSGSTDFGHMTLAHKETTNIGAVFLIESPRPHDQRESQLSEKGERKEDFSAELGLGLTSDEKQERLHGSEKNHPRIIEEQNDSQRQLSQEPNARISQGTILTNHLCKQKKIEINLKEMNSEVSESHEKEEGLLHENHMLRDEIAMLRLEIDAVKNQKQEMEKKNLEDIATVEDKNDHYQKTIKLNEETFTKKIFEYTAQLNILTAENTMLKSQLENEKENKERLETEVESYCSRLATATYEYEQGQTSKKDLELSFQKARDEWHCLQDKMNFDLSNLKGNNEMLSQQLCKAESKLNSLETELHQTRVTLREKTLVLECVQTDLSQTQCQKKEIEYKYQHEQDKVNECTEKQKSLEERLSQLQREKALLQQQLDDALHKVAGQEEALINMQEQFQDAIKRLKAESEKQGRLLQEKNQKLINECSHLKERMCRYELDKEEREVSESHEKEEGLLHENHMLRDEIAMLRLEIDTVKNQKQEMEKKHLEDIATVKDKNDGLQNTMRPNEETLTRKIFQYTAQLNILTAENTMLKSQLEDEKQKKERLETEIKSYRSKLATAAHDHEQGQTSEENLKLSFQREGDEWHCLRDKMNFDLSNLKGNNEMLSQQLCKAESKLNSLETELHQTRVALRERTLVLECVQTDLSQTQCQKKEIEYKYQHEQDKVNECTEKQKSLEERLSQLQSENALLQQQLNDAHLKVAGQEKALINMREQFQDAKKRLKAEREKLQEKIQKLINECSHLKERMRRYELDKEEREVSESHEKEEGLLHENHMLRDEIAMLRLEIDTVKNQKQEMEKKHLEDIATVKDKNDGLQNTIRLNEKTLRRIIFQYTAQLNILTAENTMLKSQLKDEKQKKERLETEIKSYRSKLATAAHDHEQGQTSEENLKLSFQREGDEWLCLRVKMNFDLSNLKGNNEMLSQQLCKAESKLNSLETELHQTRVALREKTLVLECVQTDLSQTQCQKKEIEYKYQHEQDKVNECTEKQKSLEERLSQLQSENALLQQQLNDAHLKVAGQEKALINMREQFQDAKKRLKAEREKLQEKIQKLINECSHLKERMRRYELDKEEREVQEASDEHVKAIKCAEKMQDQTQKLEIECAELKDTIKKQASRIEQLQRHLLSTNLSENEKELLKQSLEYRLDEEKRKNDELEKEITRLKELLKITGRKLNEYEKGELHFSGDLRPSHTEMDVPITKLKQKVIFY
uniref:Ankyrin repeat domain 62 n=1 Tax=Rousettus aegyptiacus TaxID=9407 RepID=A0A7J8E641_ROUAE|nr:ankyrin repeat domain 62 [Rousettus aegyptiacus]